MSDAHLRCPYCHAKLVNRLIGTVVVLCRRCKRDITLSAPQETHAA